MRWLAWYFPRLPLAPFAAPPERPFAVSRHHEGQALIDRCNESAVAAGVVPGMSVAAALERAPALEVRSRDRRREKALLEGLGVWAWRYSAQVCFDPLMVLLEVGGSLRLFGSFERLRTRMETRLPDVGRPASWAAAPTPAAAALLARVAPGTHVTDRAALPKVLRAVPLRLFTRDRRWRMLMENVGLSTLGDCLALPRPELIRRIGREPVMRLDRLLGRAPDPRASWRPPERFRQRLWLPHEAERADALRFPARRLLALLAAFLHGRDGAVQRLEWRLFHRDAPPTRFEMGLLEPTRDEARLLEWTGHRFERLALPAPVVEMELAVERWVPFHPVAGELLSGGAWTDGDVLERLRARLGEEAVQGARLCADHRPERAWIPCAPGEKGGEPAHPAALRQPLWLLPRPRPLSVREGCPWHRGPLRLEPFMQRLESGWWEGRTFRRDYYRAVSPEGVRYWVFRDRKGRWFLHGCFD